MKFVPYWAMPAKNAALWVDREKNGKKIEKTRTFAGNPSQFFFQNVRVSVRPSVLGLFLGYKKNKLFCMGLRDPRVRRSRARRLLNLICPIRPLRRGCNKFQRSQK